MAAVATRHSNNNSPHLSAKGSISSPRSVKSAPHNSADHYKKEISTAPDDQGDINVPTIKQPEDHSATNNTKDTTAPTVATNAPLAPPPKPSQKADNDYFSQHLSKEPNPFENAFGGSGETPGKPQLPGVTSLTSPASLLPGNTPGWPGSLRSGPLSPAMLTGPTGSHDYFNSDHHFSGSFPTPNESSLRSGLTPGGGGSMFPQPSPNSQALYNQLQNGGATPGTLDFHRTAMTARAQTQANNFNMTQRGVTSQPQQHSNIQPDLDSKPYPQNNSNQQHDNQDPFSSHQTTDAANGLFMLAQAGGQHNVQQQYQQMQQQQQQQQQQQRQNYQPNAQQEVGHRGNKDSIGSTMSGSTEAGEGQYSDDGDSRPQSKTKGKKGSSGKAVSNGKRKTEDNTPSKAQGNKKQKANNTAAMPPEEPEDEMDQDDQDELGPDGKKMTDEEKRKNFLERNRVAALKCRQRKKQWLANLQQKVEFFSSENDALAATVTGLREEIVGLKTLLLAHKDCAVSQAQGISGMAMQQIAGDAPQYANPYGMAMGPGGQQPHNQMSQGNMQRR